MADKNVKLKNSAGDYLYPATNLDLTQNKGTLPISKGGTGETTAADARTALDVYSKSEVNSKISATKLTGSVTNKTLTISTAA